MALPVINLKAPLVNAAGLILSPWNFFFQQFTQAPSEIAVVTPGASPYTFTASEPGQLSIAGGAVSDIKLIRGTTVIDLAGQKIVTVAIGDQITVTYSVLPTINFIPSF